MAGPAVSANQSERLSRSDSGCWLKEVVKINNPATGWRIGTSGLSSLSPLPLSQHQGLFFTARWWNPSTFLTTSQVSAGDRGNCVAITTNQSWRRLTFDVAASVWWEGEDGAEEADASRRKRREHERCCRTASTEQGLFFWAKNKKNHFLCALLFIFPVAFVLINAVIQQVVGELLPLGNSRLLPQ